jgi:rubrerythrin
MVREKTFSLALENLKTATNLGEIVSHAKAFEEDTILFYEFLRDIVDDDATKRQLAVIIAEERRHVDLLAGMLDDLRGEGVAGGYR